MTISIVYLFYSLAIKSPNALFPCFAFTSISHTATAVVAEVFEQEVGTNDLLRPRHPELFYQSIQLEATIPFSAKQNYKHVTLFLTGMQKLPQVFRAEITCAFSSEPPSPWKQLSSTASRTLSIAVLHLIPQPVGQQQQAGGQAVFVV